MDSPITYNDFLNYKCIAFRGLEGSGKTTLCKRLSAGNDNYICMSFADKLREIMSVIIDINTEDLKLQDIKVSQVSSLGGVRVRDAMINVATTIREMNNSYFVDKTIESAISAVESGKTVLIDDLRFDIEYNALVKTFGSSLLVVNVTNGRNNDRCIAGLIAVRENDVYTFQH